MNWSDIGKAVESIAPALATAVLGPAGPLVGGLISTALGVSNTPDEVATALKTDPDAAVKIKQLESEQATALATLKEQLAVAQITADSAQVSAVNDTMRVEDNTRKFSWRDYWGYVSGTAFGFVVGAVIYVVGMAMYTGHFEAMGQIPSIVGAFSVLFGIAAGVLGVQSGIETHHAGMVDRINATNAGGQGTGGG